MNETCTWPVSGYRASNRRTKFPEKAKAHLQRKKPASGIRNALPINGHGRFADSASDVSPVSTKQRPPCQQQALFARQWLPIPTTHAVCASAMHVTRLIAIRHGETTWNVDGRLQGHLDVPLNDIGLWQAQQAAKALADESIAAIYSSDLQRAYVTAQAVAQVSGAPLTADAGLRERSFGEFQGQTFKQIEVSHPEVAHLWRSRDPHFAMGGSGESLLALRERIAQTVNRIASQHEGEQIVLVAHGGVLDILYRLATRQELQAPRSWELGNAAINRLLWTPEGLTLVGWADTAHLNQGSRDEIHS